MWLLDLFKKTEKNPAESGTYMPIEQKLLEQCVEFIPSQFRHSPDFANAVAHLSHNEYAKAVRCLVQLADQPRFFFNNDYWFELKHVAEKLNLSDVCTQCDKKLNDNKINNIVLYKGIVIEKISEDTYKHFVSDSLTNEKNEERRTRDGLKELMATSGFHMKGNGHEGTIYHVNNKRVCEIRYQQAGDGKHIIIYIYSYEYLALPIRQRLSDEEKAQLRKEVTEWLKGQGFTTEFQ